MGSTTGLHRPRFCPGTRRIYSPKSSRQPGWRTCTRCCGLAAGAHRALADLSVPAGTIESGARNYNLRVNALVERPEDLANIVVGGSADAHPHSRRCHVNRYRTGPAPPTSAAEDHWLRSPGGGTAVSLDWSSATERSWAGVLGIGSSCWWWRR